jgi:hypothetical protein
MLPRPKSRGDCVRYRNRSEISGGFGATHLDGGILGLKLSSDTREIREIQAPNWVDGDYELTARPGAAAQSSTERVDTPWT